MGFTRDRILVAVLVVLWALLFLPHLRTNPNWYGDEGDWMDPSWSLAHGEAHHGAVSVDFLFPYPYPPLYLLVNGGLLRVFGDDVLVGRALQAVTALAAAGILVWIGTRLKNRAFGFLCAFSFLVYPEIVIHFRWVRSHPMAGVLALASAGFLIRYVQEKRPRDVVLAGIFCSLATATSYWAYGLIPAVMLTALFVNWRHAWIGALTACAYLVLFAIGYVFTHNDGLVQLFAQLDRLQFMTNALADMPPSTLGELARIGRSIVTFTLMTPASIANGVRFVDLWLVGATLGVLFFPAPRFRKWLGAWLVLLMYAVFKGRGNLSSVMYPATIFLPLMAVGFAGALDRLGEYATRIVPWRNGLARQLPAFLALGVLGMMSLAGSFTHFRTKVDNLAVQSIPDTEAVAEFINAHTSANDFVIAPNQLFWLLRDTRKATLAQCAAYEGQMVWPYAAPVPKELFWFDCRWRGAKYLVLAAGKDARGQPIGIDAVFWLRMDNLGEIVTTAEKEGWPVVFERGEYRVLANPKPAPTGH
jgi:hypothetical protein